jgi:acyl-[acyl-carrier-protein]-phospholipid O-acyltransferase/long-chain-fatty-acid--[acyl-carrier-protein] ligase
VGACADPTKGEQLVVLHTVDLDTEKVREALAAAGLPNLWIPRNFRRVERIPVLGTGKMDLKAIAELASR